MLFARECPEMAFEIYGNSLLVMTLLNAYYHCTMKMFSDYESAFVLVKNK
jgi:hypothetical protein